MQKKLLGKRGEDLALKHLKNKGFKFIDRNYSCRFGEIDLIMKEKNTLVFVEVKTRFSRKYGRPEEAVTPYKLKSIITTAHHFLILNPKLPKSLRIDVVAVQVDSHGEKLSINHIKNVT